MTNANIYQEACSYKVAPLAFVCSLCGPGELIDSITYMMSSGTPLIGLKVRLLSLQEIYKKSLHFKGGGVRKRPGC